MRTQRLYQPGSYNTGDEITLDKTGSQHLIKVLRYKEGDQLVIFDGHGHSFNAIVTSASPASTKVSLVKQLNEVTESPLSIHIGLAISKGEHMDYAIQKAVEAGVSQITPMMSKHSVVRLDEKRKQSRLLHWQGIIRHASEQSGRVKLPTLNPITDFTKELPAAPGETKLILDPYAKGSLASITSKPSSVIILIGPEGGFSELEIEYAVANGYKPVKLGPRVLRTETATVAACISLQLLWGDFLGTQA